MTEQSPLPLKAAVFRLAAFVEPEPLIVPIVVANFDRKLTRTTLVARVHKPFHLSVHEPKPTQDQELFAFSGPAERTDGLLGARRLPTSLASSPH